MSFECGFVNDFDFGLVRREAAFEHAIAERFEVGLREKLCAGEALGDEWAEIDSFAGYFVVAAVDDVDGFTGDGGAVGAFHVNLILLSTQTRFQVTQFTVQSE